MMSWMCACLLDMWLLLVDLTAPELPLPFSPSVCAEKPNQSYNIPSSHHPWLSVSMEHHNCSFTYFFFSTEFFCGIFRLLLDRTALDMKGEREGEWHAAKGLRTKLLYMGECSTRWASQAASFTYFNIIYDSFTTSEFQFYLRGWNLGLKQKKI